jgi:hypothetical protein
MPHLLNLSYAPTFTRCLQLSPNSFVLAGQIEAPGLASAGYLTGAPVWRTRRALEKREKVKTDVPIGFRKLARTGGNL